MLKIDELKRDNLDNPLSRLQSILLCRICRFLHLVDLQHLASTSRTLKSLIHAPSIQHLKFKRDDFWKPISYGRSVNDDFCLLTGTDLYQDTLINGGLDHTYRHRFLIKCVGHSFSDALARELRARSSTHSTPTSKIRFLQPFCRQSFPKDDPYNHEKVCEFASRIRSSLLAHPPRLLFPDASRFFTFLLDSSSSDDEGDTAAPEPDVFRTHLPRLDPMKLQRLCEAEGIATKSARKEPSAKRSRRELIEWGTTFERASLQAKDLSGFRNGCCPSWVSHHQDLMDEVFDYLCDSDNVFMDDCLEDEISRDVSRTLPSHFLFRSGAEHLLKKALFDVLRAIAILEPGMGYCQGMNFIAGVLIIETLCPVTSFWALLAMIRRKSFSGLFCPGVPSLRVKLLQFKRLASKLVPKMTCHLTSTGLNTDLIAHQCFVTAFAYFLHPSLLIRFWDAFFMVGWRVFMTLALVIFDLLEETFTQAHDAESALRILQNFRVSAAKTSLWTSGGPAFFSLIKSKYITFAISIGERDLSHFAIEHFIQALRSTIRAMELPNSQRARPTLQRSNSLEPQEETPYVTDLEPRKSNSSRLLPPFMLVPRFGNLPIKSSNANDIRALIVNFVTARTAKYFHISPGKPDDALRSKSTIDPRPAPSPTAVNWCLLASSQQATDEVQKLSVVRGRGTLPLAGFYVIIDARMYTSERETSELIPKQCDQDPDPLEAYLYHSSDKTLDSRKSELAKFAVSGTVAEFAAFANVLHEGSMRAVKSRDPRNPDSSEESEMKRRCQRSATELLRWIRAHHEHVDGCEDRRSVGRGGFVIAPLRAIIQAKLRFDIEDMQLARDREIFDQKIAAVDRLTEQRRKDLDKARAKRQEIAQIVTEMVAEKKALMALVHDTVTSPTRRDATPADENIWSRVLGGLFTRPRISPVVSPQSEDEPLSRSPLPSVDSGAESDSQHQRTVVRLQKRLKGLEQQYASAKQRFQEADQRVNLIGENIRESSDMKVTLLASYHELAVRQEETEVSIVEDTLKNACDWGTEALPLALMRIAGVPAEESLSLRLLEEMPDLYAELLAFPQFWPQFKALFLPR